MTVKSKLVEMMFQVVIFHYFIEVRGGEGVFVVVKGAGYIDDCDFVILMYYNIRATLIIYAINLTVKLNVTISDGFR